MYRDEISVVYAMTGSPSDDELMRRVAGGDTDSMREPAFRLLAARHLRRAHAIAMRIVHNREDAEEVVQEALTRVWRHAARFDPARSAFGTWFYRILANAALDRLRRRPPPAGNMDDYSESLPDEAATGEDAWQKAQEARRIQAALSVLPPRQKMAVVLCYYEDFTQVEAARIMKLNPKALESLLFRAKKSLRQSLKPQS